jgi:YD repeat-containing protein
MIDHQTPNLALPLPHPENTLGDDVARLADALNSIDALLSAAQSQISALQSQINAVATSSLLDRRIPNPDSAAYAYDEQGRPISLTEDIDGEDRVTTYAYHLDGRIDTISVAYLGWTRTETYSYGDHGVDVVTATEQEPA